MNIDISQTVSIIIALSIANERLVEIVKKPFGFLENKNDNPEKERIRLFFVYFLTLVCSLVTIILAQDPLQNAWGTLFDNTWKGYAIGALLVSGGSKLWNPILEYIKAAKDTQVNASVANQPANVNQPVNNG